MTVSAKLYRLSFFVIVLFYCLYFSRFGFENWDTGFVSAQSWRVVNGQKAFVDFVSIRPPVTAYFHGLIMKILPDFAEVYFTRILGYILFAVQVFFVVSGLDKSFRLSRYGINRWGAMIVGFILATGAIYPDPWFTVDGIFLASAAFFVMAKYRKPSIGILVLTAFLCLLSAGTKQSFYFVPILFGLWILVCHGLVKAFWFGLSLSILVGLAVLWLLKLGVLSLAWEQISGTGSSTDFLDLGLLAYLNVFGTKYIWVALAVLSAGFASVNSGNRIPSWISVLKWLSISTFLSAIVAIPVLGFDASASILLVAVLIAFCRKTKFDMLRIGRYFPLLVLVGIAWCAGLSKGFPYPVLFCHALAFAYFILMHDDFGDYRLNRVYVFLTVPICTFLFIGNFGRYREKEFPQLDYDLGTISNKLTFIRSSGSTFEKVSELKELRNKYEGNYVVAPSFPQAYYLFNDKNPLPIDWLTTFETKGQDDLLLNMTPLLADYVFIEKSFVNGEPFLEKNADKDDFSTYANYIHKNIKPLAKTKHFLVYDTSELLMTLPKYPIKTKK